MTVAKLGRILRLSFVCTHHAAGLHAMLPRRLTLADLRKAGTITSLEIVAAIDAYMLDPAAGPYCFASGYTLDVASSVFAALGDVGSTERSSPQAKAFRNRVAGAVMAACPSPPQSITRK